MTKDREPSEADETRSSGRAGETEAEVQRLYLSFSPWTLLIAAAVVGVGSVIALAIVASAHNADGLATIALALAIISFAVQLLVFVAQARATTEQRIRAEQLNRETSSLLVEVNTAAKSTQALIGNQFNELLNVFLKGTEQTAKEAKLDPHEFYRVLSENIRSSQASTPEGSPPSVSDSPPQTPRPTRPTVTRARRVKALTLPEETQKVLSELESWPDAQVGKQLVGRLDPFGFAARERLQTYAQNEFRSRRANEQYGLGGSLDSADRELLARIYQ